MKKIGKPLCFLALFLAVFLALDSAARVAGDEYIRRGYVSQNDYEITRRDHPEETWDKVFFGTSVVISAYREDLSESGYINLGIDYGVITDIRDMLEKGMIDIGSELVIGLNFITFYDDFDTDPSYPWHRGRLEPYLYFQRDDLLQMGTDAVTRLKGNEVVPAFAKMEKSYYYGSMSAQQMEEREERLQRDYYCLPIEAFSENFAALDDVANWCDRHDVRLRFIWMPQNPVVARSEIDVAVKEKAEAWCVENGVELYDMSDALDSQCFYDSAHLNYEYGSYIFTREADKWLNS